MQKEGKVDDTQVLLKAETEKWLKKLEEEMKSIKHSEKLPRKLVNEAAIVNINAYIEDSKYFMKNNDFVRSFEAVVYAWGILETCMRLGVLIK